MILYCPEKKEEVVYGLICINCPKYTDCPEREASSGQRIVGYVALAFVIAIVSAAVKYFLF